MPKQNLEQEILGKLTIETERVEEQFAYDKKHVKVGEITSAIIFEPSIEDYRGILNKNIILETKHFGGEDGLFWIIRIWGEQNLDIHKAFGHLNLGKSYESYSKEILRKWQEIAIQKHNVYLSKIEDIFWKGGKIDKDFLY